MSRYIDNIEVVRLTPSCSSSSCSILLLELFKLGLSSVFRYFNVIGSDPEGRLGEAPRPELREHGRISGACFDAARGIIPGLKVCLYIYFCLIVN